MRDVTQSRPEIGTGGGGAHRGDEGAPDPRNERWCGVARRKWTPEIDSCKA
jgi:hypothetical protein